MSGFIQVPPSKLVPETLQALLEEYASRDGTDYGESELPLEQKVGNLHRQLKGGALSLLFHPETEQWDLVKTEDANRLLESE